MGLQQVRVLLLEGRLRDASGHVFHDLQVDFVVDTKLLGNQEILLGLHLVKADVERD